MTKATHHPVLLTTTAPSWTCVARSERARTVDRVAMATASATLASLEPTARVSNFYLCACQIVILWTCLFLIILNILKLLYFTVMKLIIKIMFYRLDALCSDNNVDCHDHGDCVIRNDGQPYCVCRHSRWTHSADAPDQGDCSVETCADGSVCQNGGSCTYVALTDL